jgi:hypothetical protein
MFSFLPGEIFSQKKFGKILIFVFPSVNLVNFPCWGGGGGGLLSNFQYQKMENKPH